MYSCRHHLQWLLQLVLQWGCERLKGSCILCYSFYQDHFDGNIFLCFAEVDEYGFLTNYLQTNTANKVAIHTVNMVVN
jgi:hypothetical protein